jgi:hypothetical protein
VKYKVPKITKIYLFFSQFLVPKSSTHTGFDYVKNSVTNISSLGPFKNLLESLGAKVGLQPEAVHVTDHRVGAFLRQLY